MKRSGIKRSSKRLSRSKSAARPKPLMRDAKASGYDLERAALWHHATTVDDAKKRRPCAKCGSLVNIEAHHIIAKQTIKRLAKTNDWIWEREQSCVWDCRNGLPLCAKCHQNHETAFERVNRSLLSEDALDFADELGLLHLIERYYPE